MSDKFKHSDDDFKSLIAYKEGEIVKPLCIIIPQMTGYIKYFEDGGKNMPFVIKDVYVLDKYNKIWDKIKEALNTKFHSILVYDEKYVKVKVREFKGAIKTNLLANKIPKENMHYTSIACTNIDLLLEWKRKIICKFV